MVIIIANNTTEEHNKEFQQGR